MDFLYEFSGIQTSDLLTPSFWLAVATIIFIDLILSGDNAILIALACRNLPVNQQRKGIIWGTAGAVSLRLILGSMTIYLLKVPLLQALGALFLGWIAVKLIIPGDHQEKVEAPNRLWHAVRTIIVADAVMSLDNVIALAGTAHGRPGLLWFGLVVSIPLVVYGSRLLLSLMPLWPWLPYAGSTILGWTAGEMLCKDPLLNELSGNLLVSPFLLGGKVVGILFAGTVLAIGWFIQRKKTSYFYF
ncbi:TerC family protein [Heliobacterium chlorum]|uniref:TerC family protein n=1 Tax=Heliobacterium chlorum TaxID=2698 RepID=UPI001FAE1938|nr:TerC family protein [Heliobacterium chlorum]